MILSFTLIVAALAILLLLLYLEGGRNSSVSGLDDLAGRTRPVDLEAFRNLVDPGEEDYLALQPVATAVPCGAEGTHAGGPGLHPERGPQCRFPVTHGRSGHAEPRSPHRTSRQPVDRQRIAPAGICAALRPPSSMCAWYFLEARFSYGRLADNYQHLSALAGQLALMQHPTQAARLSTLALRIPARRCRLCSEKLNSTGPDHNKATVAIFSGNGTNG